MPAKPVLQRLQELRDIHRSSCINSSLFQPDDIGQEKLIVKNFAFRLVSATVKKKVKLHMESVGVAALKRKLTGVDQVESSPRVNTAHSRSGSPGAVTVLTIDGIRPSVARGTTQFIEALKKISYAGEFDQELRWQAQLFMRNARTVYEAIHTSYKPSIFIKYDYRRKHEEIDASNIVSSLIPVSSIASTPKLEDANRVNKKEGINILIDPSYCTGNKKVVLSITYLKPIDLNTAEEINKRYPIWSQANHSFTLRLTTEYSTTYAAPPACSLPGWQGRPPIFVPVAKCSIKVLVEPDSDAQGREVPVDATTAYKLADVSFFVWPSANGRSGVKKLKDFCEVQFVRHVSNSILPGGLSALSMAALHGNLEVLSFLLPLLLPIAYSLRSQAVIRLISNGAAVNYRNKLSKYNTALHEAVIGGHKEVVTYLLKNGANQVQYSS